MFDLEAINKKKRLNCPPRWILLALTWSLLFAAAEGQESTLCDSLTRFTCDDGICISKARLCDTYWDCAEGEDELYCDLTNTLCERNETMARMNKYECRNQCDSHADCESHIIKCNCDDECGKSCINPEVRCPNEPPRVDNSVRYEVHRRSKEKTEIVQRKRYFVGDVVKYQCRAGMKLVGPLPRCNGRGQWSREIPRCARNEESYTGLFKVTGGARAAKNSWPWQVLITKNGSTPEQTLSDRNLVGGGSLLNEKWVLTAAHVFGSSDPLSSYVISTGVYKRPLGGDKINNSIQMFTPAALYSHREFSSTVFLNDIALVKIGARYDASMSILQNETSGVIFGSNAGKVTLPCTVSDEEVQWVKKNENLLNIRNGHFAEECLIDEKRLIRTNLTSVVTGFGNVESKNVKRRHYPEYLRQASLTLGSKETCRAGIDAINKLQKIHLWYSEALICTNGGPADACQGDSGGPLVKRVINKRTGNSKWVQIGIVSYGYRCGLSYPGFYTNVARYIQWINQQIDHDYEIETLQLQNTKLSESLTRTLEENSKKVLEIETLQLQNTKLNEALTTTQETCKKENNKLEGALEDTSATLTQMMNQLNYDEQTGKTFIRMKLKIDENCPIFYKNKCFLPVINKLAFKKVVQSICVENGGRLADIYDESHFNMAMTIIREKYMNGRSWVRFWLGMTYNPTNGKVFMSNGREAKYKRWFVDFPINHSDRTSIILGVDKSPNYDSQYMLNARPSYPYHGGLCEI